jgi:hypothetical protein
MSSSDLPQTLKSPHHSKNELFLTEVKKTDEFINILQKIEILNLKDYLKKDVSIENTFYFKRYYYSVGWEKLENEDPELDYKCFC